VNWDGRRRLGPVDPRHLCLPAKLQLGDVLSAVALSLGLSFVVTIFPARRAARMNPVEALRYE
jgi:lipoprotein-releasing system permease protein